MYNSPDRQGEPVKEICLDESAAECWQREQSVRMHAVRAYGFFNTTSPPIISTVPRPIPPKITLLQSADFNGYAAGDSLCMNGEGGTVTSQQDEPFVFQGSESTYMSNLQEHSNPPVPVLSEYDALFGPLPSLRPNSSAHVSTVLHDNRPQDSHARVQARPKPQCWEHECNGRSFSTFGNLVRHQREKSGQAVKVDCPNCNTKFTRTTVCNGYRENC